MGKAQRSRQAITIRFDENDQELMEWLGQYAKNQTMTKIVKLALYQMAGIKPPDQIAAAKKNTGGSGGGDNSNDPTARIIQEIEALRDAFLSQSGTNIMLQRQAPVTIQAADDTPSSGLDMSSPRRKRSGALRTIVQEKNEPVKFSERELAKKLVSSIERTMVHLSQPI